MIIGTLTDSARIESLHPAFAQVFEYIKTHNLLDAPLERIVLDGDRLFINNVLAEAKAQSEQPLEAHRAYLDIHILLEGTERIGWRALGDCREPRAPFDVENDYMLFDQEATSYVDLLPGQFAIVYPEDAHAPLIGQGSIRKLIVKALVDY